MELYTLLGYALNALLLLVYYTGFLFNPLSLKIRMVLFACIFILLFTLNSVGQIIAFLLLLIDCILISIFSYKKLFSLCCSLWGYLCGIVINYFCLLAAQLIFSLSLEDVSLQYPLLFTAVNIVVVYAVLRSMRSLLERKFSLSTLTLPTLPLLFCFLGLLACCIIFITNFTYGEQIGYPNFIIRLNAVLFTAFFIFVGLLLYWVVREMKKNQEYRQRVEYLTAAQEYSATLEASYQELRKFKHDYYNLLLALSEPVKKGDLSVIQNFYCNGLYPLYEKMQSYSPEFSLESLQIPEVKGLCISKAFAAQSAGIAVKASVQSEIISIHMEMIDFIRILGIYFDNAIEAARESREKKLEFSFLLEEDGVSFLLANTYPDKALTLSQLSGCGYTTKGAGHGNGLSIVNDILKHYPEIEHQTSLKAGFVIQELRHL